MKPIWHILSSFILGIVIFFFTKSITAGFTALLAGVFIDLDHLIDFWAAEPENKFSIIQFYHMDKHLESRGDYYTFVFLHAWEWLLILVILSVILSNIYFSAFVLSVLLHFALDNFNLKKTDHRFTYSFIFRAFKKFRF